MAKQEPKHFGVFTKEINGETVTRLAGSPNEATELAFNLGYARQTDATAKPQEAPVDTPPATVETAKTNKTSSTSSTSSK